MKNFFKRRKNLNNKIHKFKQNDEYILIDINSGSVNVVDEMIFDIMDNFNGDNDSEIIDSLKNKYDVNELNEALDELHTMIDEGFLFAPDINVPPTFAQSGIVKSLCLMVAQDCNLNCKYCFGDGGRYGSNRSIMSEEVGKRAVDFIIEKSFNRRHCEIDFFGGEPLINFKTVKAVTEYVRQREIETNKIFKLTLTTNGILLNDEVIQWLNENNISMVLSLDGRKEIHDAMRPDSKGRGSYEVALKNFRRLVESRNGENYYMRGTYTKKNLDFTADILDMNDKGFDILSVEPVVLKNNPLGFTQEDLPKIFNEYDNLTKAYLKRHAQNKKFFFFHFNMDLSNSSCVAKKLSGCGAGHEYFAVDVNGDLYPCHQFVGRNKYKLGNVFDGVNDPNHWQDYFRKSHVLNKLKCRECWAKFYCSGGCHANADLFNDDIRKPYEIGCEIQKKRIECAIYVQAMLTLTNEN